MITSASPLAWSPSLSWAMVRFTASTGSPKSSPATPSGDTMAGVSRVTAPTTATFRPALVMITYSGRSGFWVPAA